MAEKFSYSDKSISKWESGEALPTLDVLCALADFYGVTLDYLVTKHSDSSLEEKGKNDPRKIRWNKYIIAALGVIFVWTIATFIYAGVMIADNITWDAWLAFVWAVPASFFVLWFLAKRWGKDTWALSFMITMVWTLAISIYLEVAMDLGNIGWRYWYILLGALPVTAGIILAYRIKTFNDKEE